MEREHADITACLNAKRQRLEGEVASLENQLASKDDFMFKLAAQNDQLRASLATTNEKLAAEEKAVDELLEFKATTCLEAQRRLMCPRE